MSNLVNFKQAKTLSEIGYPQVGYTTPIYVSRAKTVSLMNGYTGERIRFAKKGELIVPKIYTFRNENYWLWISNKDYTCPTLFDVAEWFRTKFNIDIIIGQATSGEYFYTIDNHENDVRDFSKKYWKEYNECLSCAIDKVLTHYLTSKKTNV